jgi:UDP-N-acetylglucosamine 2-epimerase (non-hydrolysing)
MGRSHVAVVMGTRPEALKLAPVVHALRRHPERFETSVVVTGQHREMLDQMLGRFGIAPDADLDLMRPNQTLTGLTCGVLAAMTAWLATTRPDVLVVQGDTTTAFAAALAAFYARTPVAHVEAGLRSDDLRNPFPEEANRRLAAVVTDLHFAPTRLARRRLLREGVPRQRVVVTGNTIVDSLLALLPTLPGDAAPPGVDVPPGARLLVVTSHRRESWGRDLENVCFALRDLVRHFDDLAVVYPVHLNPNVRETVARCLDGVDRVALVPPLDYVDFVALMRRADVLLTDSGGIQEEAPSLGKPLLVLRRVTERPEAMRAGLARLVGTDRATIVAEVSRLLTDPAAYRAMTEGPNPYGDGRASERIVEALARWLRGRRPVLRRAREFRAARLAHE